MLTAMWSLVLALSTARTMGLPASQPSAPAPVQAPAKQIASASELTHLANGLADLHRFDEAITAYSLALEQEPRNGEILANRALSYAWINRVDEASADLKLAEQFLPDSAVLHRVRAIIADRRSDDDTELAELSKSLEFEPTNPFARVFRAQIYQKRHLYRAALDDAEVFIRAKPDEPEAYRLKAALLGSQRRWPEALAVAKLLVTQFPRKTGALASAAQIYSNAGDRTEALATIGRALQLDEGLYRLWDIRSGIRRWDDFEGRERDLENALELAPGDLGLITELGLLAFNQGRWLDAKRRFTEVLEKEPKDFGVLAYRAMSSLQLAEPTNALEDYNSARAVASGPDDLNAVCRVFARENLALNWGLATCNRALASRPGEPFYLVNRGLVRLRLGDVPGAYKDFDQAIAKDPDNSEAYYGRAIANHRRGSTRNAVRDRMNALAINPNIEEDFCAYGMSELYPQQAHPARRAGCTLSRANPARAATIPVGPAAF